jgi:hypothetical protein
MLREEFLPDGEQKMWPLFEFAELDPKQSAKMRAILGYVEHLKGDFYRIYDSSGEEITIIDRRGILIRAIQKESEQLLKDLWSSQIDD